MFEYPVVLLLLILLPAMGGFFVWRTRIRQAALQHIGEPELVRRLVEGVSETQRRWKSGLWLAALTALIFALARPVWGVDAELIETRGVAVMIVLDVSESMNAQDVLPNRLERARLSLVDLLNAASGNLFGLVLFAGDAVVQFPLTSDSETALMFVRAASTHSISRQGTAVEDALRLALSTFDERITNQSMIILLTDGENHEGDPLAAAETAADSGVTIHVIGYGNPEGATIPVYDDSGTVVGYKTDRANNIVLSRLDESTLQQIAAMTGGTYQRASNTGVEVINLYHLIVEKEGNVLEARLQTRGVERFGIFVALALIALSVEMLIPERKVGMRVN
jgi:Ca-activated chloride channel homolog